MNVCRDVCRPSCAPVGVMPKAPSRKGRGELAERLRSGLQIRSAPLKSHDILVADRSDKRRTDRECVPRHFPAPRVQTEGV